MVLNAGVISPLLHLVEHGEADVRKEAVSGSVEEAREKVDAAKEKVEETLEPVRFTGGENEGAAFLGSVLVLVLWALAARCLAAARSLARLCSAVRPLAGARWALRGGSAVSSQVGSYYRFAGRKSRRVVATRALALAVRALR